MNKKQLTVSNPTLTTSKIYDATTTAAVTVGTLSGVEVGDVVTASALANYDNENVGNNKQITVVYTIAGSESANYLKPIDFVVTTGEIIAKQLTVSNPTLTTSKTYDATTTAAVTVGTLSGVELGDVVTVSALANYDNENVGTNKQITVVYMIAGSESANYLKPIDFVATSGELEITHKAWPNPFKSNTVLSYLLPESGKTTVKIFNQYGQLVQQESPMVKTAGSYRLDIFSTELHNSGTFYYEIILEGHLKTYRANGKLVLIR